MGYTKFGEYFRILRIKHREVLADAKTFLGVSSAFISSVECGKKAIPQTWFGLISEHYNLNEKERAELCEAIDLSQQTLKLDLSIASQAQKQVAIQFQRSFQEMDDETASEIKAILERK